MTIKNIFRKYDLRGTVGLNFKISDFYKITKAIVYFLKQKNKQLQTIALAMDGRLHSEALKDQVTNAIIDSGVNVKFVGLCPTPALYYASHNLDVDAGLMITASHNPGKDNGLKIVCGKDPVWAEDIQNIYDLFIQGIEIKSQQKGQYTEYCIIPEYINFLISKFEHLKNLEINAIIDCSNGTAGSVMPEIIKKMNWKKLDLLFSEIDGNFPNHDPDPTDEKNLNFLKDLLSKSDYRFALGLDGDCDRLCLIDKKGKLIPGDQLLSIYAQSLFNKEKKSIVFDVKCSNALVEICKKNNITTFVTPTGSAYIKESLKRNDAMIGGELSGHFCFNDNYFGYDDGIYAIFRLLEIINTNDIEELLENFPKKISSREIRIECGELEKDLIIKDVKEKLSDIKQANVIDIDGVRLDTSYGWGILRASNTESMLSLRFEGDNQENFLEIKKNFYEAMLVHFEKDYLKKKLEI